MMVHYIFRFSPSDFTFIYAHNHPPPSSVFLFPSMSPEKKKICKLNKVQPLFASHDSAKRIVSSKLLIRELEAAEEAINKAEKVLCTCLCVHYRSPHPKPPLSFLAPNAPLPPSLFFFFFSPFDLISRIRSVGWKGCSSSSLTRMRRSDQQRTVPGPHLP
jgi:hypothetical protein